MIRLGIVILAKLGKHGLEGSVPAFGELRDVRRELAISVAFLLAILGINGAAKGLKSD
jgi:hypothetical protein